MLDEIKKRREKSVGILPGLYSAIQNGIEDLSLTMDEYSPDNATSKAENLKGLFGRKLLSLSQENVHESVKLGCTRIINQMIIFADNLNITGLRGELIKLHLLLSRDPKDIN